MPSILLEIKNGVGLIILNRPEKLNSFNREMALLLQEKLETCSIDKNVRCIHITGAGKGFSAGQDLSEVADSSGPSMQQILSEHYNPIITQIRNIPKPFVAAVNGVAAGAGANIALSCDIVVAAQSASFIQAFSKIGLIPDSGGTFFLPRLIGFQKASAVSMLGDKISATEAERIGLVYKTYADHDFAGESEKIAYKLAEMPTRGLGLIKKAMNASLSNSLEEQLKLEDQLQQEAAKTYDYKEGVQAFLEKRPAKFRGE